MKTIAEKIEESLESLNMTQKKLAKKCGVTEATISRYISGARNPRGEILSKIASVIGVSTDYLLGNSDIKLSDNNNSLNQKDEKDIEKALNKTLEILENQEGLMLSGQPVDEQDFELIKLAIKNGLEYAKISNKKKYTPKKYK